MNVARDVILDLLPLYQEGEASEDTRRLVAEYLKKNPELAPQAGQEDPLIPNNIPPVPKELEMEVLERTRRLQLARSWILGFAIFLTASCFSFAVSDERGFRWLVASNPTALMIYAIASTLCWLGYLALASRLR